jgi:hypothetical protein
MSEVLSGSNSGRSAPAGFSFFPADERQSLAVG